MGLETKISILCIIIFGIEAEMYDSGDIFKMAIIRPFSKFSKFQNVVHHHNTCH